MKNMILVLALLIFGPLSADIHIQTRLAHTKRETSTKNFEFVFNDTDNRHAKLTNKDFELTYFIISVTDKEVTYAIELFVRNAEGELKFVTKQIFVLAWGKEAYVRFGKKDTAGEIVEDRLITFVIDKDVVDMVNEEVVAEEAVVEQSEVVSEQSEEAVSNE